MKPNKKVLPQSIEVTQSSEQISKESIKLMRWVQESFKNSLNNEWEEQYSYRWQNIIKDIIDELLTNWIIYSDELEELWINETQRQRINEHYKWNKSIILTPFELSIFNKKVFNVSDTLTPEKMDQILDIQEEIKNL